jgi:hypothetical protein
MQPHTSVYAYLPGRLTMVKNTVCTTLISTTIPAGMCSTAGSGASTLGDLTHTIMTTKHTRRVGITCMRPFVYQRLSHTISNPILSQFDCRDTRQSPGRPWSITVPISCRQRVSSFVANEQPVPMFFSVPETIACSTWREIAGVEPAGAQNQAVVQARQMPSCQRYRRELPWLWPAVKRKPCRYHGFPSG